MNLFVVSVCEFFQCIKVQVATINPSYMKMSELVFVLFISRIQDPAKVIFEVGKFMQKNILFSVIH